METEMQVSVSNLTKTQLPASIAVKTEVGFLTDFISSSVITGSEGAAPFVASTTARMQGRLFGTERVVRRECYDHLLPIIEGKLSENINVGVEGTPGIGKTVFGLFVLRSFVEKDRSVVYWDGKQATLFTKDEKFIELFGLAETCNLRGAEWHWGAWMPTKQELVEVLLFEDIYVIHDPAPDFLLGGSEPLANNLVIILAFGHALLSYWATKGNGIPEFSATMPVFAYDEILANKNNLFHGKAMTNERLARLHMRFGGSIRHWAKPSEDVAWQELEAKILDVAKNGSNITKRTPQHRGSVVHVAVDFDGNRRIFPNGGHNTFKPEGFILGSVGLTNLFSESMAGLGKDQLKVFMNSVKGEKGAEAVYGILFEKHAHEVLRRPDTNLNIRVVRHDGRNKYGYATTKIEINCEREVLNFEGQEAKGINEMAGKKTLSPDTCFLPSSSTFPTYDAAMVVPGTVVGLGNHDAVGLLLQMTVSGATNILRRPEHAVKRYMRNEMHTALKQALPDFKPDLSVTTFCVPTACFHPFLFQPEQQKNSKQPVAQGNQAEFQFVIEIPEFTHLPMSTMPKDMIHGASGRTHRYMLRSDRPKRIKLDKLYETNDKETTGKLSDAEEMKEES